MKVMILSASTGGGHMSAANAIKRYLVDCGNEATVIDALEYISPILNKTVTEGYEYLAKKVPKLYGAIYNSANKKVGNRLVAAIISVIGKKLSPLIEKYEPDVLVSTHPFCTEMASRLKEVKEIRIPLVCIMTDYAPHRTWISDAVDAYVVADEGMIEKTSKMGVPKDEIYPFGIPVEMDFYTKRDRSIILKETGLNPSLPTILFMAGSFGVRNVLEIYEETIKLPFDFQIIVITGRNKKLYDAIENVVYGRKSRKNKVAGSLSKYVSKLKNIKFIRKKNKASGRPVASDYEKKHKKNTRILYFTTEVYKYMKTADLIITKPGGLTITEALACDLPMAVFDAIPGQEEENADFLVSNNMAVKLGKGSEGVEEISKLLADGSKLRSMKSSCETFDKSNSLENIAKLLRDVRDRKSR